MTSSSAAPLKYEEFLGHPKGLYVCFLTEMWERFSFYGMKALLFLYITKYHLFSDDDGYDLLGAYAGLAYALPVIGGLIADRWIGMRRSVVFGGLLLVAGHFGMAVEGHQAHMVDGVPVRDTHALQVFYLSLALIIVGVGFLKPNISTIVGKLYPENDPRRDSGFTVFYAGINLGALFSSLVCAWLGETYGWRYGFGSAGIGMVIGLATFLYGQKHLHGHAEAPDDAALSKQVLPGLSMVNAFYVGGLAAVGLAWQLLQRTWTVHGAMHVVALVFSVWFVWYLVARCNERERAQMLSLVVLILASLVFFTLYEQTYGSWIAFNDRLMTKNLLGFEMTAGSLTFLGAFFIVGLAPIFAWLWPWLEKRNLNPSKPLKSTLGIAIGGLAFVPLALAAKVAGTGALASVWWLVLAYFVLEVGEVMISPIGLSAVSQLSAPKVVSVMMGSWFLATSYSEVLAAALGKVASITIPEGEAIDRVAASAKYAELFWFSTWLGLGFGVFYLVITPWIRRGMRGVK